MSTSNSFKLNSNFAYAGETVYLTTSQDNYNIYATFQSSKDSNVNVKLAVQEVNSNEAWVTIETIQAGNAQGGGSRSVQFTNYSTAGDRNLRVVAYLYDGWTGYTSLMQTCVGSMFIR
ncbi:hypothetical protein [Neobacillus jeddahensis]|uniref:hypothetical protein n=1 Tax=Neobacillus jeddahensis TaxID=1461580 RepID=UPI00058C80D0|nr:hypothetical protein [Neobacillus jeddahensis]